MSAIRRPCVPVPITARGRRRISAANSDGGEIINLSWLLVAQKSVHRCSAFGAAGEEEKVTILQHANLASWDQGSHELGVHQGHERIVVAGKNEGLLPHQRQEGQA